MRRRYWRGSGVRPERGSRPGEGGVPERAALVAELSRRLRIPDYAQFHEGPIPVELFVANVLHGGLKHFGVSRFEDLNDSALIALWLVLQVIVAPDTQAEAALSHFIEPRQVGDLRTKAAKIAAERERYLRERQAFDAAVRTWRAEGRVDLGGHGLLGFVLDQAEADPALWHALATEIDLDSKDQLSTVLWAITQPECNAGTLCAFLSALASSGRLPELIEADRSSHGMALTRRVGQAIRRWNHGWPGSPWQACSISHGPATAQSWAAAVAAAEAVSGPLGWAEPEGLFRVWRNPVDAPALHHWEPELGLMVPKPQEADYVQWRDDR
ncbi:hypothetical protein ACXN5S_01840 [Pseudoroseicyclus sp. H15]